MSPDIEVKSFLKTSRAARRIVGLLLPCSFLGLRLQAPRDTVPTRARFPKLELKLSVSWGFGGSLVLGTWRYAGLCLMVQPRNECIKTKFLGPLTYHGIDVHATFDSVSRIKTF